MRNSLAQNVLSNNLDELCLLELIFKSLVAGFLELAPMHFYSKKSIWSRSKLAEYAEC
jgi:hypothetical protein